MNFLLQTPCDCPQVVFVDEALFETSEFKDELTSYGFKPKSESAFFLQAQKKIFVGVDSFEADEIRVACAKALSVVSSMSFESLSVETSHVSAVVEGFELGSYQFNKYKSISEPKALKNIYIITDVKNADELVTNALIIARATNFAKDIVNTIPNDYTPLSFAEDCVELCEQNSDISCKIFDEGFLQEQGMNAFLAVNRASPIPPRLIHLTYKPQNSTKRVIFVGKGLTYDSGGLSLKPGSSMVSMKADKSGAAAALAIIKAAAELKLPIEVHSIIGATENMIGGDAYKPDDVLVAKNGTTIEVRNTDAEGRLVLADCLGYAQEFEPDLLVDMATLTGACVVALGEFTVGVMGHNHALKHSLHISATKSGEYSASLPFNKHLAKLIKSDIADVSNISSSRYGGAITAGLFLDKFIDEKNKDKWLHLDIAGPAYIEKQWGYNQSGASGAGVRMCVYWLSELAKEKK